MVPCCQTLATESGSERQFLSWPTALDNARLRAHLARQQASVYAHSRSRPIYVNPMCGESADLAPVELQSPWPAQIDRRRIRLADEAHLIFHVIHPERPQPLTPGALAVVHLLGRLGHLQPHCPAIANCFDHEVLRVK